MFDVGFSELMVIGVVALVVIGPERLPKVARTAGQWLGKLNRYVSQVKQDTIRDMKLEELRKMQQDMKDSAQKYEILAEDSVRQAEETVAQETAGISKVMEAMSLTDGGLTMQEFEKLQAKERDQGKHEVQPQIEATGTEVLPVPEHIADASAETATAKPASN